MTNMHAAIGPTAEPIERVLMSEPARYRGSVVVIPTRNRAELAMNAIRSVLSQPVDDVQVLVSDNSTLPQDRAELARFCEELADPRLRYVAPPEPLSMTKHWDWAIAEAMRFYDASHFIYLTDRMMFKSCELKRVTDLARLYPDKIISYNHDRIVDFPKPIRVERYPSTGKLFEIDCVNLSYIYSQAVPQVCLPRMLNCIVPRNALEAMRQRFGDVFSSISPDFNFGFRCLEIFETVLFYDWSAIFHYALERSNGASVTRGELTSDYADFIANLPVDNSNRNYATPIPQIISASNAIYNEYCVIKQETKSPRFFELNIERYLRSLAEELAEVPDSQAKVETYSLLVAHGLKPDAAPKRSASEILRKLVSPRAVGNKLNATLKTATTNPATKRAWLFLMRRFGIKPPDDQRFEFDNVEEAINFMNQYARARLRTEPRHEALRQARELPATCQNHLR
jgi:glycosyltransferase involved in cell wall biosynthesis